MTPPPPRPENKRPGLWGQGDYSRVCSSPVDTWALAVPTLGLPGEELNFQLVQLTRH